MATELVAQSRELVEISETELRKASRGQPGFRFLHDTWLVTNGYQWLCLMVFKGGLMVV